MPKSRYGISKNRPSFRRREQPIIKYEANDLAPTTLDVTEVPRESYQFLLRYKCLIETQDELKLKLFEVHIGKLISVSSGTLQSEIFKKLVLGVFASHINYFNKEVRWEPASTQLIEKCLKFLPRFLINDELFQIFAQKNGVLYLEMFAQNVRLAPIAFEALHQISKRKSHRIISNIDGKSVRIFKDLSPKTKVGTKPPSDQTLEAVSSKAIDVLLSCGKKLLSDTHEGPIASVEYRESAVWNSTHWTNFLKLLDILNEMQMESLHFRERFYKENWHRLSFDILKRSLSVISNALAEIRDYSGSHSEILHNSLKLCLPTLKTVLPISLSCCNDQEVSIFSFRNIIQSL